MKMSKCALCKVLARTFCESDQAALCWDCDARVHGANFLVARHTRTLLCHACQRKTPWTASGAKLGHTVSLCDGCVNGVRSQDAGGDESGDDRDDDDDMSDDDDEADRDEDEDEDSVEDEDEDEDGGSDGGDEDGDNQVVPWSPSPPPPPYSSSSSDESVSRFYLGLVDGMCSLKRTRESSSSTDLPSLESPSDSSSRRHRQRKVAPTVSKTQSFISEAASVSSPRPASSRRVRSGRPVGAPNH